MKVLKYVIILLIIVGAGIAIYFFYFVKEPKTLMLDSYLQKTSAFYHRSAPDVTEKVIHYTESKDPVFYFINSLNPEAKLQKIYNRGNAIISWHLSRQENLIPVIWLFVPEDYNLENDSLPSGEEVGELIEMKSSETSETSVFIVNAEKYVAIGTNGEIMQEISNLELFISNEDRNMDNNTISGNIAELKRFMKRFIPSLKSISLASKSYSVSMFGDDNISLFHGFIDSSNLAGIVPRLKMDNVPIPLSAQSMWYCKFDNAASIMQLMNDQNGQLIWDLEEKYQFKVQELIETWLEGTVAWFYYSNDAQEGLVVALKLRNDAAPFAAASQFFTEFSSIDIKNREKIDYYTIARFVPSELVQVVFPGYTESKNLFILEYGNYLYLSGNKTLLNMVVNELVNNRIFDNMNGGGSGNANFRFIIKHLNKKINIQGKLLENGNGLYMQGSLNQKGASRVDGL